MREMQKRDREFEIQFGHMSEIDNYSDYSLDYDDRDKLEDIKKQVDYLAIEE